MKAAVLHAFGEVPRYEEFPDPVPGGDQKLVEVRAVALENVVRGLASGTHYGSKATYPELPAVVGIGGVGALDGKTVTFGGCVAPFGAMAERTIVPASAVGYFMEVPDGVDPELASAVPSSAITALGSLSMAAPISPGAAVLVQGATGFAGRLAVQIAKLLGAGRVVGTGRDPASLQALPGLGADAVIDLARPDAVVRDAFAREAGDGYDVVLDYIWGHPTEVLLETLVPKGFAPPKALTRVVHIGAAAGHTVALAGEMVRTSGVSIVGLGGLDRARFPEMTRTVFEWIRAGQLRAEVERVPLAQIAEAWVQKVHGRRLVITP